MAGHQPDYQQAKYRDHQPRTPPVPCAHLGHGGRTPRGGSQEQEPQLWSLWWEQGIKPRLHVHLLRNGAIQVVHKTCPDIFQGRRVTDTTVSPGVQPSIMQQGPLLLQFPKMNLLPQSWNLGSKVCWTNKSIWNDVLLNIYPVSSQAALTTASHILWNYQGIIVLNSR